jgi:hypothetical protein
MKERGDLLQGTFDMLVLNALTAGAGSAGRGTRAALADLARLAPGTTMEEARADLARMMPIWLDTWPSFPGIDRSEFVKAQVSPLVRPLKQERGRRLRAVDGEHLVHAC